MFELRVDIVSRVMGEIMIYLQTMKKEAKDGLVCPHCGTPTQIGCDCKKGEVGDREQPRQLQIIDIDLSEGWDTESQAELLVDEIKKQSFYRGDLLYSGFDGEKIGSSWHSNDGEDIVYCSPERYFFDYDELYNPFSYAEMYSNSAIAVYDPDMLEKTSAEMRYKIQDDAALLAILRLKY